MDDFLFSGSDDDPILCTAVKAIQAEFKWGTWEEDTYVQCGVRVHQLPDFSFELSQASYVQELKYINLRAHRKKDRNAPTDDWEKSQLRTSLGGVSWHSQQLAPHFAADVGLLLSEINYSTIDTVFRANKLMDHVKSMCDHKLLIHALPLGELSVYTWVDAAIGNRRDAHSTQGIIVGVSTEALFRGSCEAVSLISWHSQKIPRAFNSRSFSGGQLMSAPLTPV